jgi:Tfp pilus assembly protein PilF
MERQNRPPEAQKQYERMVQINPNAAVAANNLAWFALSFAVVPFGHGLARDPANPGYLSHLGRAQMRNGSKTKARGLLERALRAYRTSPKQLTPGRRLRASGGPQAG